MKNQTLLLFDNFQMIANASKIVVLAVCAFALTSCPPDNKIDKVIEYAKSYKGVRYKYGGESRNGIDCSALMQKSFASQGISLPRRAVWQSSNGSYVSVDNLDKGDLIFFKQADENEISHVGLIISGNGRNAKFIHASGTLGEVSISRIGNDRWLSIFVMGKDLGY